MWTHHLTAFALLAAWLIALAVRSRRGGPSLDHEVSVAPIQALQPMVQLTILSYWAIYWTDLRSHAGFIALHILFCYGLDLAWSWTLGRRWRLTLGVFPVVFSTNLFLYYQPEHMILAYALYAVAFGGKALVTRSSGRHVFNPSALGMSVMILGGYAAWWSLPIEVDHAFLLPPNMIEVLFLIALIGQTRIPIVFTTLGAYASLNMPWPALTDHGVSVFYPSTFIAILLLVTDPRTSPRTPVGQLLFGATYGLAYHGITDVSSYLWGHDGSAKVLAVLPANLVVPWVERLGERANRWLSDLFEPPLYKAWVGAWIVTIVGTWGLQPERKQTFFHLFTPDHVAKANPWVQRDDGGRITCEANPVFCTPFSFPSEARMWIEGSQPGTEGTPLQVTAPAPDDGVAVMD